MLTNKILFGYIFRLKTYECTSLHPVMCAVLCGWCAANEPRGHGLIGLLWMIFPLLIKGIHCPLLPRWYTTGSGYNDSLEYINIASDHT